MPSVHYDDSRIQNNHDKKLLERLKKYFDAFTTGDFDGVRNVESEGYTITNILFGLVRVPRASWYEINKGITHAVKDWKITAITLAGSSEPGSFAILEHENAFTLAVDPPADLKPHFTPGAKAGDRVTLINLGALWFEKEGKISRELVYGRLAWPGFSLEPFQPHH